MPETYLSIQVVNDLSGHHYDDLQKKENDDKMKGEDKIYDIVWDWNVGRSVVRERQQPEKRADDRYIQRKTHKQTYSSRDVASRSELRYVERPLPKPPKTTGRERPCLSPNPNEADRKLSNPQSDIRKHVQRSTYLEVSPNQVITSTKENHQYIHSIDKRQQTQMLSGQSHLRNELESALKKNTKSVSDKTSLIPPVDYDVSDLPPVPKRPLKNESSQALLAPDMADQRRKRIPSMSVSDVGYWLGVLKLDQYVGTFKENLVDGSILPELDDDILQREFKMSRFHTIKLRKFLTEGYIPRQ